MATPTTYSWNISVDETTTQLTEDAFPYLSHAEWEAFQRMRSVIGDAAVINVLTTTSEQEQKATVIEFMNHENITAGQSATPGRLIRTSPLKIDVSKYKGGENEPLLRWFVELDATVEHDS